MKRSGSHTLINRHGRKYLSAEERATFINCVRQKAPPDVQTFVLTLTYTGCRVSEALALRARDVDLPRAVIYLQTLKRRREAWREVPIPTEFCRELELTHRLKNQQLSPHSAENTLWHFSRTTAYRRIVTLMRAADITGPQATPRGLRHSFGIAAVEAGMPLPAIAAILGHADITTTSIYTTQVGTEAREYLKKIW